MKRPKLTRERLAAAIHGATSLRQVLIRLDVAPYGGSYGVLRRALTRHNIDTSQFAGRAWSRSRSRRLTPRKPLAAYLDNTAPIQSYKLKTRLLREGLLERRCLDAGIPNGKPYLSHSNSTTSTGTTGTTGSKTCGSCVRTATH